ncbi:motility associated factor glycosyltransferase family protein [bacterium]|nr:motility associated factor glycosyltransferase family protein [bacterium]
MSQFAQNLELLRKASEPLAARMEAYHDSVGEPRELNGFMIEPARSGELTVKYTNDEHSFYLHSPYDPLQEAQQYSTGQLKDAGKGNFIVFFGMGLGHGVKEVIASLPDNDRVLVFEPHWDLFYLAFCHTDLAWLLTRDKTTITCDPSVQGALLQYMNLFELAGFKGVKLFSNAAFERLPAAEHFNELAGRIRYEMLAVGGNVQTLMIMGEMQQMNIILNFPQILDNPPFLHLIDKFKGRPAIIVSAGPSLEKNMHLLRDLQDKALIIAVDTSIKPLLANGITPHVVVTGDPQEANSRHLRGVDAPDTYLIAEPQSPIASFNGWTGGKFVCTFHDNMMQWIDRVLGTRGRVLVWGSVAVMAYDVSVKIGADPIVFIGQDLSFPGGRTYTKGTFFETEDKMQLTVEELQERGTQLIEMTDIYGEPVQTNKQMYSYYNFLINRFKAAEVKGRRIINATEGGILKSPQVEVMTLQETVDKYITDSFDVRGLLDDAYRQGNSVNYTNLLLELDSLIAELRLSHEACQKGISFVGKALGAMENEEETLSSKKEIVAAYNRVVSQRKQTIRNQEVGKIVEMANQSGIYSFARGVKNLQLKYKGTEDYPTDFIKSSLYHYHTLYVSTRDAIERLIPPIEAAREAAKARAEKLRVPVGI